MIRRGTAARKPSGRLDNGSVIEPLNELVDHAGYFLIWSGGSRFAVFALTALLGGHTFPATWRPRPGKPGLMFAALLANDSKYFLDSTTLQSFLRVADYVDQHQSKFEVESDDLVREYVATIRAVAKPVEPTAGSR